MITGSALRSLRRQTSKIAAAQRSYSSSLYNVTKPNPNVFYIANNKSTEDYIADFEALQKKFPDGILDFNYKTKYPEISVDECARRYEEEFRRPFYVSEKLFDIGDELLGFDRELLEMAIAPDNDAEILDENGELDIEKFTKFYSMGATQYGKDLVDRIGKMFLEMRAGDDRLSKLPDPPKMDYEYWEKELGKETMDEVRTLLEYALSTAHKVNSRAIYARVDSIIESVEQQLKDRLIDELPLVKELHDKMQTLSLFIETGEDGLPKHDFRSIGFIEQHFPEVIDNVIEQIELGNWDIRYEDEEYAKIMKVGPEFHYQKNKDFLLKEIAKDEAEYETQKTIASSVTEEEKNFQLMYAEVMNIARQNKVTESEIGQLKFQLGVEEGEHGQQKKKAEKVVDTELDKMLDKVLGEIMSQARPKSTSHDPKKEQERNSLLRQIKNLMAGREADYVEEVSAQPTPSPAAATEKSE